MDLSPFTVSNDVVTSADALRRRFDDDGYLFFKGLLPAIEIERVRHDLCEALAACGVLEGDRPWDRIIATGAPFREGDRRHLEALRAAYRVESFHRLAHHTELLAVLQTVLGPSAFPHPLSIIRMVFPDHEAVTTPPHQDYPNNQGTQRLTAAWIPLGRCPQTLGSLRVLRGSHRFGVMPLEFHLGPGNRAAKLNPVLDELTWHGGDFAPGDVLFFQSLTVHAALPNRDPEQLRLSVDFRYQCEGEALTPGCLEPHFGNQSWDDIYAGWGSSDLKYYWRKKRYEVVPWNEDLQKLTPEDEARGLHEAIRYDRQQRERTRQR